jgi:myosin heavy subunit
MASDSDDDVSILAGKHALSGPDEKKLGPRVPHLEKELAAIKKKLQSPAPKKGGHEGGGATDLGSREPTGLANPRKNGGAPGVLNGIYRADDAAESDSESDDEATSEVLETSSRAGTDLTKALAKKFQVSLDDEKNIKELEDPDLVQHMADARSRLTELERKYGDIPAESELAEKYAQTLRTLSSGITTLTEKSRALQAQAEQMHLGSSNALKLSRGEQPHGYPAVKPKPPKNAAALKKLGESVEAVAKATEKVHEELATLRNNLTVMRRDFEFVVDNQKKVIEHYKAVKLILMPAV